MHNALKNQLWSIDYFVLACCFAQAEENRFTVSGKFVVLYETPAFEVSYFDQIGVMVVCKPGSLKKPGLELRV